MATVGPESDRAADVGPPEGLTPGWRDDLGGVARRVATALMAGMACGAVIAGLGGRIAMFVLRLTSDDSIRGINTDDGFEIGRISANTLFLVFFTTLIGAFGGAVYLAGRRFVPANLRVIASALGFGVLGGTFILKPGEFDFVRVEPPLLSVALFILIPVAYGALLALVAERWLATDKRRWFAYLPILVLAPAFPFVGFVIVAVLLGFGLVHAAPAIANAWRTEPVTWLGRAVLSAGVGYGAFILVDEAASII